MSMAMRRGRRPLTWGADQGLRLVGGGKPTTMQQASSRALENPAIANYRFMALKVPPGTPMFAAGLPSRREAGVASNFSC